MEVACHISHGDGETTQMVMASTHGIQNFTRLPTSVHKRPRLGRALRARRALPSLRILYPSQLCPRPPGGDIQRWGRRPITNTACCHEPLWGDHLHVGGGDHKQGWSEKFKHVFRFRWTCCKVVLNHIALCCLFGPRKLAKANNKQANSKPKAN